MATELLLPDAVVTATNLSASIGDLDEGLDNFDGVYATNLGSNANTLLVLSFPTPTGTLTTGAGLQTFRARVRSNGFGAVQPVGGNDVTGVLQVREGGIIRASSTVFTIVAGTGISNITFTWDADVLALQDGSNVQIGIAQQSGGQGGNSSRRRWLETDTAEWTADYIEGGGGGGAYSFSTIF